MLLLKKTVFVPIKPTFPRGKEGMPRVFLQNEDAESEDSRAAEG